MTVDILYQLAETPKAFFVCIAVETLYNTDGIRAWVPKSISSLEGAGVLNLKMEIPVWFYENLTMPEVDERETDGVLNCNDDHPDPLDFSQYPF